MCEHAVVRTPLVANTSLTPSGMPASDPPSWLARAASARAAISCACSGVSSTKALSARASLTAATWALVNSTAENSRLRSKSRACARVSEVSWLIASGSPRRGRRTLPLHVGILHLSPQGRGRSREARRVRGSQPFHRPSAPHPPPPFPAPRAGEGRVGATSPLRGEMKSPPSKEEAPPVRSRQTTVHLFRRQGTSGNPFLNRPGRRFVTGELAYLARHDRHRLSRTNVDRPWSGRSLLSRAPQLAARFVEIGHVLGGEFFTFVAHRQILSEPSPVRTKSCPIA